ncbi:MAG: YceI family protein [Ferruginibacter sp.]
MKLKAIFILTVIITASLSVNAQKVYTKNGAISFFSKASIENISADNNQVVSVLTLPTGELQFSVLIKGFHFKKSLMEEHFNENYMESDKYPKATFKGTINDLSKVNFTTDGNYTVEVAGDLTIHGITNKTTTTGTITVKAGTITATSKFKIKLSDYKISIPKIVKDNIAEVVDVTVSCVYDQKL